MVKLGHLSISRANSVQAYDLHLQGTPRSRRIIASLDGDETLRQTISGQDSKLAGTVIVMNLGPGYLKTI